MMDNSSLNNTLQISQYNFKLDDLDITSDRLIKMLGHTKSNILEPVYEGVNNILDLFRKEMIVKCGYKRFDGNNIKFDNSGFSVIDVYFDCGKIIGKYLKNCESLIFLVVTLGDVYEKLFESFKIKNDYLEMYLVDKIASEIVEAAADKLEKMIEENLAADHLQITNRYSPGYCGWNVSEQKKLFSFLPHGFCGVTLNESAMMTPIKSISAVIGFGKNTKRQDYNCSVCHDEFCYKRKDHE